MPEFPFRVGPKLITTSPVVAYSVPTDPDEWAIVRSIIITNIHASTTGTAQVFLNDGTGNRVIFAVELSPGQTVEAIAPGFLALPGNSEGHSIQVQADGTTVFNITISGVTGP